MIKNSIFALLIVLSFTQCKTIKSVTQPIQNEELSNEDTSYERGVLIIYYDKNIGKELLMQEVKSQNATLLYDYTNLNGIAIYLPQEKDINKAIKHFEKVKGVLSVSKSQNMQLH